MKCIFNTRCSSSAPYTKCFCGTLSDSDCAAAPETGEGSPSGACAGVIKAGMGPGVTNAQVLARFTDTNYAAGAALKRWTCLNSDPVSNCGLLPICETIPCLATGSCRCPAAQP
jgi:hypothetical protein